MKIMKKLRTRPRSSGPDRKAASSTENAGQGRGFREHLGADRLKEEQAGTQSMRYVHKRGIVPGLQGGRQDCSMRVVPRILSNINSVPGCVDSIPGRFAFIRRPA